MNKFLSPILEIALKESLKSYESKKESNSLSGLRLYFDYDDSLLVVYDDEDHVLNKIQIPDNQFSNLIQTLRHVFNQADKEKLFEKDYIEKPFIVNLIDKDFTILDELFFLDNDTLKTTDITWKNIERDLDAFLDNLLK